LREGIEEIARSKKQEEPSPVVRPTTSNNDGVPDLEQLDIPAEPPRRRAPVTLETDPDEENEKAENDDDDNNVLKIPARLRSKTPGRLQGESNLEQFDRVVHEILSLKREETSLPVVSDNRDHGSVRRPGHEILKEGMDKARSALKRKNPKQHRSAGSTLLLLGGILVLSIGSFWFALGCYGLYHLVWKQQLGRTMFRNGNANNEIVIRVVKEVVHKSSDGKVLGRGLMKGKEEEDGDDDGLHSKLAECVAKFYN